MDVKTAGRTLDVFEAFAATRKPLGVSEMARQLGTPVSSCFNLLRTMEARGFLYSLGARRGFYPTKRMLARATAIAAYDPLTESVGPVLASLRDQTGETVLLGKLQGDKAVYLDVYEPEQSIRYTAQVGDMKPLHSSAMGKALLASLPNDAQLSLVRSLPYPAVTLATITDASSLLANLEAGKERGWQMTRSENVADVMAIGATFRFAGEHFGLVIAGPVHRMEHALERHAEALSSSCRELEDGRDAS